MNTPPFCDNPMCPNHHGIIHHEKDKKILITEAQPEYKIITYNQFEILGKRVITYCPVCESAVDFVKQILAETKAQQHKL